MMRALLTFATYSLDESRHRQLKRQRDAHATPRFSPRAALNAQHFASDHRAAISKI